MVRLRFGVALAVFALLSTGMPDVCVAAAKAGKAAKVSKAVKARPAPKPPKASGEVAGKAKAKAKAKAEAEGPKKESLWQYVEYAGTVGYVIIGVSFLGVALILKQLFCLRRGVLAPKRVQAELENLFKQRKIKEAMAYCQKNRSMLARVVAAGLSEIRSGYQSMSEIMQDVGEEEAIRVNQSVGYLSLVGAIAPMLGLLGTVLGMIGAFQDIASAEGMAKPAELAYNIQKALTTTCMGLIVAVPAIVFYTFFRNKAVRVLLEVGVIATELTSRFKTIRVAAAGPQPAAPASAAPPAKKAAPAQGKKAAPADDKKPAAPDDKKPPAADDKKAAPPDDKKPPAADDKKPAPPEDKKAPDDKKAVPPKEGEPSGDQKPEEGKDKK